jgi:hypothetical protein
MAHFTQLNLGSKQPEKPATTPRKRAMMVEEKAVLFGALVMICLTSGAVLLTTQGCSRASDKPAASASQTQPISGASGAPVPAAAAAAPAVEVKKKAKRPAIVTYKDSNTGLSFQYPRKYTIKTGNAAKEELAGLGPVPMNFAAEGGKTLATIEINDTFYPGTDLKTAFVNVSVNRSVSAEKCSEFSVPVNVEGSTMPASTVAVGENEFMFVEDFDEMNADQAIGRYYHTYENGTCYEFALGIATDGNGEKEEVRAIDRDAVFEKLTKIVASAQIESKEATKPAAPASVEVGHATQPEAVKTESAKTEQSQTEPAVTDDSDNR